MKEVKFGLIWRSGRWERVHIDFAIDRSDWITNGDLRERYIEFLRALRKNEIKPSTLVSFDLVQCLIDDMDKNVTPFSGTRYDWNRDRRRCDKLRALHPVFGPRQF